MAGSTNAMVQVNVRVSPNVKRDAEAQLERMGSSVGALVRQVLEKASRSPKDCAEVTDLVASAEDEQVSTRQASLLRGWEAADSYCRSLGLEPGAREANPRTWDEVYQQALDAHFAEKGLFE